MNNANEKIRLGISTCLLGENVRYDGGHKHDRWLTDILGRYVEYVPVCPEHECGLSIPREAMRLVGDPVDPRLVTIRTGVDHTARMKEFSSRRVGELESEDLCGYIFKAKSPSSGMERIKVYNEHGMPEHTGVGLFARAFMDHFPLLPVEDEGRLHDPRLRENFIERIFVMKRWREMVAGGRRGGALVAFHTDHKLLLMAHGTEKLRPLGRLVADISSIPAGEAFDRYLAKMMELLALKPTVRKHTNALQHAMGHLKKLLSADEKSELLETIEHYRLEHLPLIVPVTLLNHYVRKFGIEYLARQYYLHPHPIELKLRNHV